MASKSTSRAYYRLADDEGADDIEAFLDEKSRADISTELALFHRVTPCSALLLVALVVIATALGGFQAGRRFPTGLDNICSRYTNKYSPILDDDVVSYDWVQYNGNFTHENTYRQVGGPEVDAAWEALGTTYRPMVLPDDEAADAGLTKNHTHIKAEYGGGYPVFMEGLHHLHCLNLVRKSLYYNYDYYLELGQEAFSDPPHVLRWHVSHCVDIIRQRLMCTVDTGVFGSVWLNRSDPRPFVDFNTRHVCKNYDAIRAWAEERQMPQDMLADVWEPPGDNVFVWESAP